VSERHHVRPAEAGLTLIELLGVIWLLLILLAMGAPALLSGLDDSRTYAAARFLASQCHRARSEAVSTGARTAMRFQPAGVDHAIGRFRDRNGNGVRSIDIARGIDLRLAADVTLGALFPGVRFGVLPNVPLIDGGFGSDPIRLGSGSILTFAPDGTASGGSLYIRGSRGAQYAVRIFGVTGRTRVFKFHEGAPGWKPL
jgi:type II secretory pathway pseudopilin PulG